MAPDGGGEESEFEVEFGPGGAQGMFLENADKNTTKWQKAKARERFCAEKTAMETMAGQAEAKAADARAMVARAAEARAM